MQDKEEKECNALVPYERNLPAERSLNERLIGIEERARRQLREALEKGIVRDPVSMLIAVGVAVATAGAQYLINSLFAPKQQPQTKGQMTGELVMDETEDIYS